MLTMLLAVALTQAPTVTSADAPNCTAVAKLPTRLAPVWVYPTFFGNTPIAYAQAPADKWNTRAMPGGGYMSSMAADGSLPGWSARGVRAMTDLARANGGVWGSGIPTKEQRNFDKLLDDALRRRR